MQNDIYDRRYFVRRLIHHYNNTMIIISTRTYNNRYYSMLFAYITYLFKQTVFNVYFIFYLCLYAYRYDKGWKYFTGNMNVFQMHTIQTKLFEKPLCLILFNINILYLNKVIFKIFLHISWTYYRHRRLII